MEIIVIYWRDIPAQVMVRKGRGKGKAMLSPRFQEAIDRAAMRARRRSSDAYMSEWNRVRSSCENALDLQAVAEAQARDIEAAYSEERLSRLIKNHGRAES